MVAGEANNFSSWVVTQRPYGWLGSGKLKSSEKVALEANETGIEKNWLQRLIFPAHCVPSRLLVSF